MQRSRLKNLSASLWTLGASLAIWAGAGQAEVQHDDGPGTFKGLDIDQIDNFQFFEPLNMELVGELALGDEAAISEPINTDQGVIKTADLAVSGNYAYVGGFDHALHVVSLADPNRLSQVARLETPAATWDVKIEGNLAALGVQSRRSNFGLVLADITDPTAPKILSQLSASGWGGVHNIYLYQQRAYLAHSVVLTEDLTLAHSVVLTEDLTGLGISVINIADPTAPVISGEWSHDSFSNVVHDIFIRDGIGYASDFFSGLALIDLSDLDQPRTMASIEVPEGTHSA